MFDGIDGAVVSRRPLTSGRDRLGREADQHLRASWPGNSPHDSRDRTRIREQSSQRLVQEVDHGDCGTGLIALKVAKADRLDGGFPTVLAVLRSRAAMLHLLRMKG